jgi:flagellar hook-associated protein 2
VRLDRLLDTYVDSGGLIEARTKGLQNSIKDIGESRDALAERLTKVEARLRRQYGAMDILVAQLRNTGNYLASQLASLTTSS